MKEFFNYLDENTADAGSWTLEFNDHKTTYEDAEDVIQTYEANNQIGPPLEFQSKEHRQRAIDTNKIYYLHWYKNTPVGFLAYAAPTLEELADWVMSDK